MCLAGWGVSEVISLGAELLSLNFSSAFSLPPLGFSAFSCPGQHRGGAVLRPFTFPGVLHPERPPQLFAALLTAPTWRGAFVRSCFADICMDLFYLLLPVCRGIGAASWSLLTEQLAHEEQLASSLWGFMTSAPPLPLFMLGIYLGMLMAGLVWWWICNPSLQGGRKDPQAPQQTALMPHVSG